MSEFIHSEDKLFAGDFPLATEAVPISSGEGSLLRGTVLGVVTATGKLAVVDKLANDGSQTPYCVLAEDIASVIAAVAAQFTVELSGSPASGKDVTLSVGTKEYTYTVVASDTLTLVAAGLVALVTADTSKAFTAANSAGVITLTAVDAGATANTAAIAVEAGDSGVSGAVTRSVSGVDASGIDATFPAYVTGQFNPEALTFAAGTTAADMKVAMRNVSLFQRECVNL